MPSRIQGIPKGLLSLLGIHSTGRNPDSLTDQVVSTVDLGNLYLADKYETVSASGNVTNEGDGINIDVPAGELWSVQALSVSLAVPSGLNVYFMAGFRRLTTDFTIAVEVSQVFTAPSGMEGRIGHWFDTPLILPPNGRLRGAMLETIGTAQNMIVIASIARLRI